MRRLRSVMLVADIFPPFAAVGVYRTAALSQQLTADGVRVTVLTARGWPGERLDEGLRKRVPPEVRVVAAPSPHLPTVAAGLLKRRGRADSIAYRSADSEVAGAPRSSILRSLRRLLDWASWWLHTPDTHTGWLFPAVLAGCCEARRERPSVIYSTGPAWTSHLVGAALSKLLRKPLVADFQDPWCGSYWRRIPHSAHRWLDEALELLVVKRAARITCAWDGIRKHLVGRYPHREGDIVTILNGFWPDEMQGLRPIQVQDGMCVLVHAGSFYGPRSPVPLFAALQQLRRDGSDVPRKLRIVLLGPTTYNGRSLQGLAEEHGVSGIVQVLPPSPRQDALAMIKGADVALLFGQSGYEALASVPAKTFDYVSAGTPVLAIGCGVEVCGILQRGGCRVWEARDASPAAVAEALRALALEHDRGTLRGAAELPQRMQFAWPRSAAALAEVIESVAQGCTGSPCAARPNDAGALNHLAPAKG